jgi:hypothetical protein
VGPAAIGSDGDLTGAVADDHRAPIAGPPALIRCGGRDETRHVTAELLVLPPVEVGPRADYDHLRRLALGAVVHPGGRPWRLAPIDGGVQVLAEGSAGAPLSEVGARTVRLTAGAALANMRLGIAALGHRPVVTLLPRTTGRSVLAVLRRGAAAEPTPIERALATVMASAAVFLPPVADVPAPAGLLLRARAAVEAEGLWLRTVEPYDRARLARMDAGIAALPAAARLMAIGGNHDVPVEHIRAGASLQTLVLTVRLLGGAVTVAGWPTDVARCMRSGGSRHFPGPHPYVLVAVSDLPVCAWSRDH